MFKITERLYRRLAHKTHSTPKMYNKVKDQTKRLDRQETAAIMATNTNKSKATEGKKDQAEAIHLKLRDQNQSEMFYKIRFNCPFKKLFERHAKKMGGDPSVYRFLFDGERILPHNTPEELDMVTGDEIDVVTEQVGGFEAQPNIRVGFDF